MRRDGQNVEITNPTRDTHLFVLFQLERIEGQLEGLLERSRKCANDVSELGEVGDC